MYSLIDLFCGAGGMTLGFTSRDFCGGFQSIWAVDNDPAALRTYATNFLRDSKCDDHVVQDDIERAICEQEIPEADVVIGGPPCQGFSLLNKGRKNDARRSLWQPYMHVVDASKAKVFVIENVQHLFGSPELMEIEECAAEMGYETRACVLNAADYGVPQTRKRTVVIGWKTPLQDPSFPPLASHKPPGTQDDRNIPSWVTVKETVAHLGEPVGTDVREDQKGLARLHFGRSPTKLSRDRYRKIPTGGNRFDLQRDAPELTPECWKKKQSGGTDLFGRLWWDRPSVTIRTEFFKPEKGRYLHPDKNRPITHCEAALLMGFPNDFAFVGTKVEIARQIGNAVPPGLAAAVAKEVRKILSLSQDCLKAA